MSCARRDSRGLCRRVAPEPSPPPKATIPRASRRDRRFAFGRSPRIARDPLAEQRAVFLLREVFDPDERIAEILGSPSAAVRQLAVRARRHCARGRAPFETSPDARTANPSVFEAFERSLAQLEGLLADDVTLRGDGGGKAPALARWSTTGRVHVARTLLAWARLADASAATCVK